MSATWTPADIEPRLANLAALRDGWEEGALAISPESVATMRAVLAILSEAGMPRPHVYPTPKGGLQCEWRDVEGEIETDATIVSWWFQSGDVGTANAAGSDVERITRAFVALTKGATQ